MKSLNKNPENILRNIKCPDCTSSGWYRTKDGRYVCKKCGKRFEDGA